MQVLLPGIRASWQCPCADIYKPRVNVLLTLCKLGSYREALGGIRLPALNLRFKGYASGRYSGEQFNLLKATFFIGGFFVSAISAPPPQNTDRLNRIFTRLEKHKISALRLQLRSDIRH